MIILLAFKNIWRNKVRSLVVMGAITIGIFGGLFFYAMMIGLAEKRINDAVENEVSHIKIHHPDYVDFDDIKKTIPNSKDILDSVNKVKGVVGSAERVLFEGMTDQNERRNGVVVVGVNAEQERKISGIPDCVIDTLGNYFEDDKSNFAIIGLELAEKLKTKIGRKVKVKIVSPTGNAIPVSFKIRGIYKTKNSKFDKTMVFVRKDFLLKKLNLEKDMTHEIAILLDNKNLVDPITDKLSENYSNLRVRSWVKIMPEVGMMDEFLDQYLFYMMGIILLALGFGIVNTMLMVILERIKELGMLMAIGMNRLKVFALIMFESLLLCLIGGIVGMIITYFLIDSLSVTGIDLSVWGKGLEAMGYDPILYPKLNTMDFINLTIMIIMTGIIASIFPAIKAIKLKPVEALRTD